MKRAIAGLLALAAVVLGTTTATAQPPLNISAANVTGSRGPEGDIVLLNGDVRITRGLTVITADRGRYLRSQGMLYLDDRVRLVDTTTTLRCQHAAFSEEKDLLEVTGDVVITDRGATLKAPFGTYDRGRGRAELYGGVVAEDSTQIVHCERLTYWRDSMLVKARGRVRGDAKKDKFRLLADSVDYDRRAHLAVATGKPMLESEDERGRVARISAKRLRLNTETRRAEAIDSVLVDRDTLKATGDYAVFDDRAERGWLYGHPRAWDNETTVTGDTLEVWTVKRTLQRFVVRSNATLDYQGARPGSEGETSRLTGDRMDVFFADDEMDSLMSVGNARNEYQAVARPGKTAETNLAVGDTITVHLKDGKIDRAVVRGKASGEYHMETAVGDTTAAKAEIVKYRARRIEFHVPKDRIVLDEGAELDYRDVSLSSRRVEFDSQEQVLVASGKPQLVDRGDKVTGNLMTYDLESRQGTIYQAETTYERGLYHGEAIRKVNENELDVKSGAYSTCSLEEPHYHFQARWMKIYLKDKMVAKPVVFYIRNVPLLALPFWIFPIKPGRHSGVIFPQFEIGLSTTAGQFIRNAGYYYAPNDYMDFTVAGDYYQAEPSWVIRGEANYKILYMFDGQANYSFARNERDKSDNYDFNAYHQQEFSPRTRLQARGSFVSSRAYSKSDDFGRPLSNRLNRFLTSNMAISHAADWASFYLVLDQRQDLDADESIKDPDGLGPLQGPAPGTSASLPKLTQSFPNLSVTFPTRAIGTLPFLRSTPFSRSLASMYFSMDSRILAQSEQRAFVKEYMKFVRDTTTDSTTLISHVKSDRWGNATNASLRDSRRLFGWLNLSPSFNTNAVIWDFDNQGNHFVPSATWNASVSTSTTFYSTSRMKWGPIVGIRHVVFPSVGFRYSPTFDNLLFTDSTGTRSRFTPFGGIGISGFRAANMGFSLDQRWQVKLMRKGNVERLDNLLQWSMTSAYNFLAEEQTPPGREPRPLSPINSSVRFSPPGVASGDLSWIVDPYEKRPLRSLGYSIGANFTGATTRPTNTPELALDKRAQQVQVDFSEPWSLGLAFSYSGGYAGERNWSSTQTANGVARFNLTPNWHLEYSTALNLTERDLLTQRFGLVRDLHCWQASFTRIFVIGGEAEYYFRLTVKDQRELYVERGTRIGSIGGIQ